MIDAQGFYDLGGSYIPISSVTSMPVFVGPDPSAITAPATYEGTQTMEATFPNSYDQTTSDIPSSPTTVDNTAADLASGEGVTDVPDLGVSPNGMAAGTDGTDSNGSNYVPEESELGTPLTSGSVASLGAIGSATNDQIDSMDLGATEKSFDKWVNTCEWDGVTPGPDDQKGIVVKTGSSDLRG